MEFDWTEADPLAGSPDPVGHVSSLEPMPPLEVGEPPANAPKSRKRLGAALSGVAAVAVLGAGSYLALGQFNATADSAASPEAAVQQFFDSLAAEDLLGAAETVDPTERRTMINPGIEMVGELKRLGVLSDDMDLGAMAGVDFEFSDMTFTPEALGGGVVRVAVGGSVTSTADPGALPLGDLVTENMDPNDFAEIADAGVESTLESIDDMGIVAVERDGGWYVSLWYSAAEGLRRSSGMAELPSYGNGPTPNGSETPEGAVEAFAESLETMSLSSMIATLDPDEMAALYDYSTLFLAEAQSGLDSLVNEVSPSIEIDRLDLRSTVDGDDGVVMIDGMAMTVSAPDLGSVRVDTAASCMAEYTDLDGVSECAMSRADFEESTALAEETYAGLDGFDGLMGLQEGSSSVRVHRTDGQWFISPMSSMMDPMLELVRAIERDDLETLIDDPFAMIEDNAVGEVAAFGLGGLVGGDFSNAGVTSVTTTEAAESFEQVADEIGEQTSPIEWVTVYVVTDSAPAGTAAYDVRAEPTDEPLDWTPGAMTSDDAAGLDGKVTLVDLAPGDVLLLDHFSE